MKLLDRLERRFGRYAVPNLTLLLIVGQVVVYFAQLMLPRGGDVFLKFALFPELVLEGQVWRLVTFLFIPPAAGAFPIFVIFFWLIYYMMGTALETTWGDFRYGVFLAIGYLASIAAAFLVEAFTPGGGAVVGDYLYGSVFLAFARLYPDFEIMLFFVLPVKVKWFARLTWLLYAYQLLFSQTWVERLLIVAAVLNFLLFFGGEIWRDAKQGHKRMRRQSKQLKTKGPTKLAHECRVCGLTSDMAPKTSFRYCSQCEGQQCYCPDHIRDHEHVTSEQ
ncbi:hypothetical protein Mal64_28620 [Pseudobythopirellula maris]|uniref:Rhomboid family protein n=1 Tax=Pseudobythopirellula maris TaxID=2527991 RepID=A0A5C5ZIY0_9BACT|nr:rhomboid family intramembrane serine protease [Pseudobythopirellula maris]TWT87324.1 hypothetical protein Mal64_28620 [Pseudobythopirellula maris]